MLLTISNLYPRPDRPQWGIFNAALFRAFAERISVRNVCLVPEWRIWRWPLVRNWADPSSRSLGTRYLPVFYAPLVGRDWTWFFYWLSLKKHASWAESCWAIYSTWLYPDGVAATRLAAACGVPSWIMVQGSDVFHLRNSTRRRVIAKAAGEAAGMICVSGGLADALVSAGIPRNKIHVVPNGVDTELFRHRSKEEARAELLRTHSGTRVTIERLTDRKTALFVGNLEPKKGPDVLVDAWRMLRSERPDPSLDTILLVAGDGSMRRAMETQARQHGFASSLVFLGTCPHKEIALWMNLADCLCLPSRSEGMPNVVLEALAAGLPVVASDVGAVREMLSAEPMGHIVPVGQAAAVARAMREVLDSTGQRTGRTARHRNRTTWTRTAETIMRLMRTETPPYNKGSLEHENA